jgi:spermidine synthase
LVAALANAAAAGIAMLVQEQPFPTTAPASRRVTTDASRAESGASASASPWLVASALAFLSGFAFITLEVVWSRIAAIVLAGTTYGVGTVLICVLLGIAAGGWLSTRILSRRLDIGLALIVLWTLATLSVCAFIALLEPFTYYVRQLASLASGAKGLHLQLAAVAVALVTPSVFSGACLPLVIRAVTRDAPQAGRSTGLVLTINTAGCILGSLAAGFVLLPRFGANATLLVGIGGMAAAAALALVLTEGRGNRRLGLVALLVTLAATATFDGYDARNVVTIAQSTDAPWSALRAANAAAEKQSVYAAEGETSTVQVKAASDWAGLTLNGLGQGSRNYATGLGLLESVLVAAVPLLHTPEPKEALVVGLGAGVTIDAMLALGVPKVRVVELERKVVEAVDVMFDGDNPARRAGVELSINDARHELLVNARRGGTRYDVITSMPAHPWVASPLFTREFFALAKANLSPQGVFSSWFGATAMDREILESLVGAFTSVFDHYVVYFVPEAGAFFLVGGVSPLSYDVGRLLELAAKEPLRSFPAVRRPEWLAASVVATADASTPKPKTSRLNTDDSCFVELRAPLLARTPFSPSWIDGLFPLETLAPRFIRGREPKAFLEAVLEEHLGTLAVSADKASRDRVEQQIGHLLAEAKELVSPDYRAYVRGRVAAADHRVAEARQAFAEVKDESLAPRAQLQAALLPDGTESERRARLASLPWSTEVALALTAESLPVTPRSVSPGPGGIAPTLPGADASRDDWSRWLVLRHERDGALDETERRAFETELLATLGVSMDLGAVRLALELAERSALGDAAAVLRDRESALRMQQFNGLRQLGLEAYRDGRCAEAVTLLERARAYWPAPLAVLQRLRDCYLRLGDPAGVARSERQLLGAGVTGAQIASIDRFLDKLAESRKTNDGKGIEAAFDADPQGGAKPDAPTGAEPQHAKP